MKNVFNAFASQAISTTEAKSIEGGEGISRVTRLRSVDRQSGSISLVVEGTPGGIAPTGCTPERIASINASRLSDAAKARILSNC